MAALLQAKDIQKGFGGVPVLKGITLTSSRAPSPLLLARMAPASPR